MKDKSKEGKIVGMQFNISTGGAREEQRILFTSREIIQALINDLSGNNQWTPKLAKTIFELLVPNDFKEQLKKQANINWIVDKDTASYPWELLQDSTHNAKPLCINAGMVRQLATQDYRVKINSVSRDAALVIADPDLKGFAVQLPGALKEGDSVYDILDKNGIKATKIARGSAAEIIQALFSEDYKIIHLAGHGMFSEDPSQSGMLIGNNVFLSTREISQMSSVPEMVFVNCCHLGKTDGATEALYRDRFKLAANIGTQLIENGVKVVIAAGWAVDDAAALEFTEIFYKNMFEGAEFGQAVLEARRKIYEKYWHINNTWGAYQCYGDQFYTLKTGSRKFAPKEYVIAREAEIELSNLLNKLEITGYTTEGLLGELNAILKAVDAAMIRNGEITELEALIYAGLCMYEQAMMKYESLLIIEHASFSFSAMEKYCNVRPKYYVSEFKKSKKNQKDFLDKIEKVIGELTLLISYSPTAERLNMMGSAYKSKAVLSSVASQKISAYKQAALYYYRAYTKQKEAYSLSNWLEIENILQLLDSRAPNQVINIDKTKYIAPDMKEAAKDLESMLDSLANVLPDELTYWDLISTANIKLCLLMIEYKAGGSKLPSYDSIFNLYKDTWDKGGSRGKKIGEIEHLDFLIDALTLSKKKNAVAIKSILNNLRTELEKMI